MDLQDLNIADNVISTPLCTAARKGDSDALYRLLEKGHHVNLNDNRGWTPLHEAVAHGQLSCVRLLLQWGNANKIYGGVLRMKIRCNIVAFVLDECDTNARNYEGMSPVYMACQYQNNVELIKLLVENGVSCNIGNTELITPLHVASKLYKLDLVKELVKHGALVNAQDFNNFTPLMEAIEQITSELWNKKPETPLEVIRFLLDNGASVASTDFHGRTALFIAVCEKWYPCVQLLLEYDSDVNARTRDGGTALLVAAQSGNLPLLKLLLDHGATTDNVCDNGTMPLHHALHNGYVSVAEELIKKMDLKNIIGKMKRKLESFLILAIDSGSFESFKLVMNNKLYAPVDRAPFSLLDSTTLLDEACFRHYIYQNPLSFLLSQHIEEPHAIPMLKQVLDTGDFPLNTHNQDFMPPLVALIAGSFSDTNKVHVNQIKLECFLRLLEKGADIDYISVKNCCGSLQIPDAVMAVVIPRKCSVQQTLLVPVLSHCFACNWDDIFDWLVQNQTCSAAVLHVLIRIGVKSKQQLLQVWEKIKHCPCYVCKKEFLSIQKLVYEKDLSLQSLCRAKVRHWLWQKTGKSNEAEKLLHKMCIPLPVRQYIVPEKL